MIIIIRFCIEILLYSWHRRMDRGRTHWKYLCVHERVYIYRRSEGGGEWVSEPGSCTHQNFFSFFWIRMLSSLLLLLLILTMRHKSDERGIRRSSKRENIRPKIEWIDEKYLRSTELAFIRFIDSGRLKSFSIHVWVDSNSSFFALWAHKKKKTSIWFDLFESKQKQNGQMKRKTHTRHAHKSKQTLAGKRSRNDFIELKICYPDTCRLGRAAYQFGGEKKSQLKCSD